MKYILLKSATKIVLSMVLPVYLFDYLIRAHRLNVLTILIEIFLILVLVQLAERLNQAIFNRLVRNRSRVAEDDTEVAR